jgi:Flp pilus assembly protein TadD
MKRCLAAGGIVLFLIATGCSAPVRTETSGATSRAQVVRVEVGPDARKELEADAETIAEAMRMMQEGRAEAAIAGPLADLIDKYSARYPSDKVKVYCAAGDLEAEAYAAIAQDQRFGEVGLPVVIIDNWWAQAHFVSAYGYSELGRHEQARVELARALELSPMNSQYTNELAYHRIRLHEWDEALHLYRAGEVFAELGNGSAVAELKCTALRGQGYALVELHRVDEAIEAYKKCLALIPDEPRSLGELSYIRDLQK